jgi:Protein of unknown function (DUF3592)
MIPAWVIYSFGALFIVFGCIATVLGIRRCKEGGLTRTWPSVEGMVVHSAIVETPGNWQYTDTVFQPVITYQYQVSGRAYTGKRIKVTDIASGRKFADGILKRYPIGAKIPVYHDPENPHAAVLQPGNDGNSLGIIAVGTLFVLVGVGICVGYRLFQNTGN